MLDFLKTKNVCMLQPTLMLTTKKKKHHPGTNFDVNN